MRILVHDYAGHPFQVQLSRGLAGRGHTVLHSYSAATQTPRGELTVRDDDPKTLEIKPIHLDGQKTIAKYNFLERFKLETEYGHKLVDCCAQFRPEVVLSANTPSLAQASLAKWCTKSGSRLVNWIQDLYGVAAKTILTKKIPVVGHLAGNYLISLDKKAAKLSSATVVITEDFVPILEKWGINPKRIHTIHNWAPLESLPVGERDNSWSAEKNLAKEKVRFVYSGTLSIRHNPELLASLAEKLDQWGAGELIVISEGSGINWLKEQSTKRNLRSLRCLDFQPFNVMNQVFASADVLVAILEPDSGVFCVPSKVLSYMCAARALLLAVPSENLSARIVKNNHAGLVVPPDNVANFLSSAERLYRNAELRRELGQAARNYAEKNFDFQRICDRFETILQDRYDD